MEELNFNTYETRKQENKNNIQDNNKIFTTYRKHKVFAWLKGGGFTEKRPKYFSTPT